MFNVSKLKKFVPSPAEFAGRDVEAPGPAGTDAVTGRGMRSLRWNRGVLDNLKKWLRGKLQY